MWNKLRPRSWNHISEWNLSELCVPVNVLLNQKRRAGGLAPPSGQLWAFLPIQDSLRAPVSQILSVFSSLFFSLSYKASYPPSPHCTFLKKRPSTS